MILARHSLKAPRRSASNVRGICRTHTRASPRKAAPAFGDSPIAAPTCDGTPRPRRSLWRPCRASWALVASSSATATLAWTAAAVRLTFSTSSSRSTQAASVSFDTDPAVSVVPGRVPSVSTPRSRATTLPSSVSWAPTACAAWSRPVTPT